MKTVYIEGVEIKGIDAEDFDPKDLERAAHSYPDYTAAGGTSTFHGFLIEVIRQVQKNNAAAAGRHYSEHLAAFVKSVGMVALNNLVARYKDLRPRKKKDGSV